MQDIIPPWCLIESDPAVFTSLIRDLGVKDVEVEEIWDPDMSLLGAESAVYGVIFLFKWDPEYTRQRESHAKTWTDVRHVYFAKQVVPNACATQAILSILLNTGPEVLDIGSELDSLRSFTKEFDPSLKGMSIGQCEAIMRTHNSFATPVPIELEKDPNAPRDEDAEDDFHYVAFVPIDGTVYELDGLLSGPVPVASYPFDKNNTTNNNKCRHKWTPSLLPVIKERIARFSQGEIRFNLMLLGKDPRADLMRKLDSGDALSGTERSNILHRLDAENLKHEEYEYENSLRRHNYLPFAMQLLRLMAAQGSLASETAEAVRKAERRAAKRLEEGAGAGAKSKST